MSNFNSFQFSQIVEFFRLWYVAICWLPNRDREIQRKSIALTSSVNYFKVKQLLNKWFIVIKHEIVSQTKTNHF